MTQAAPVVLITVYKCEPANQEALVEHLTALSAVQRGLDGFISATLHQGLNGNRVANYAVWATRQDWEAMTRKPAVAAAMEPVMAIATFEPNLYEAGEVFNRD